MFLSICLALFRGGDYEAAGQMANLLPSSSQVQFVRMISAHQVRDKEACLAAADELLGDFSPIPSRYLHMATRLKEDVTTWEDKGLGPVARKMRESENRLKVSKSGPKTQSLQRSILGDLDKLIKEQENKGKGDGEATAQQSPIPTNKDGPAPVVTGDGKIDEKVLKQYAENWGALPPKERKRIVDELTLKAPQKYKAMIEEYFAALNRSSK